MVHLHLRLFGDVGKLLPELGQVTLILLELGRNQITERFEANIDLIGRWNEVVRVTLLQLVLKLLDHCRRVIDFKRVHTLANGFQELPGVSSQRLRQVHFELCQLAVCLLLEDRNLLCVHLMQGVELFFVLTLQFLDRVLMNLFHFLNFLVLFGKLLC